MRRAERADDAVRYIQTGPLASYERFGFGLYVVELKEAGVPLGICGLLKRDTLTDVDVGFAFLPEFWSQGYAFESAAAVLNYGREELGLRRIVAITSPDNDASMRLLEKIGLRFEGLIKLASDQSEVRLFGTTSNWRNISPVSEGMSYLAGSLELFRDEAFN